MAHGYSCTAAMPQCKLGYTLVSFAAYLLCHSTGALLLNTTPAHVHVAMHVINGEDFMCKQRQGLSHTDKETKIFLISLFSI